MTRLSYHLFYLILVNSFYCDLTRDLHSAFISYHLKDLTRLNRV